MSAIMIDGRPIMEKNMNYNMKILNYLLPILILFSINFSQDLSVDLTLLNTSQFTLNSWNNVAELWNVEVLNTSSEPVYYKLKFQLYQKISGNNELIVEGRTKILFIQNNGVPKIFSNLDPELNESSLEEYIEENPEFISNIENVTGYFPSGTYKLKLSAIEPESPYNEIASDEEDVEFSVGDQFSILNPPDGWIYADGESFYFQWDTPGFRQGVQIEFRLLLSAIIPDEVDSPEDAIEMGTYSDFYFDSNWNRLPQMESWPYIEKGFSDQINFWYSYLKTEMGMDPLQCGFEYAWRIDAREVIDGFETVSGNLGLWGWPEPVQSVVWKFTWGEIPKGLISPAGDDVLPLFMWDNIGCADDGFDFQLSPIEDEDFGESWGAEFISTPFQYPTDAPGLIPGKSYKWRVRIHSLGGNTQWSEFETFTIQNIELIEPQIGKIVESVRPYFNVETPANISHYELLIGDENDEYVEQVEIYNREEEITSLPWQYPSQNMENGLYPNMVYYWKLLMFDGSGNILGEIEDYEVMGNFRILPIILTEPSNGGTNIPLNQKFTWDGPLSVPSYEFWISDDEDPEVEDPKYIVNITGSKSFDYPEDDDYPLEYEKSYYWKIVPKDVNDNYGLPSSYSIVSQFTTLNFPELGEELSVSNSDVRIPIINIETSEGIEYTIFIYGDADGSTIIEEISGITNFPYEYSDGKETLQYGTTYYIQIQPMKNGENFGNPSNMMPFSIPEEPENTEQCEISCEITDSDESEILISILTGLEEATEYLILVSQNEDMSNALEFPISSSESQYLLSSEYVDWGNTYYTQVVAYSADGEIIGIASEVQVINVESKPGTNEQTAIGVNLPEGSIKPIFEIINEITGATGYQITISTESDMSAEWVQFSISNSLTAEYPSDGPPLQYGKSYYVVAQGLDDDNTHGIVSSVVGFFIPNITPPKLGEAFNWEASIPAANQYRLEISLVEDFSALVLNNTIEGTTSPMNKDELEFSKGYYWKVQGLDEDGNLFGNSSQISFFQTPSVPAPTLNAFSTETPLTPDFSWSGIEMATGYQITVSGDGGMENILWQKNTSNTSVAYPESATLLEFASTYFWQVASLGENEIVLSISSIESFSTKSVYPIIGLNPDGGTETLSPTLQWEANDKITAYLVNVGTDAEMSSEIVNEQADGNSIQVDEGVLTSGNSYYWIVDGLDENGESLAGPSNPALILMPSTDNIPLISPIGDEQVSNLNPVLKWGSLLGTTSYTLRVGADPEFENILINTIVSGNEIAISEDNRLNNSITYFWQLEGATETAVIISNTGSFVTPPSAGLTILGLEDGEVISVTNPTFSWEAGEGISAFSIRFSEKSDFSENWSFQIGAASFQYSSDPPLNFDTPYYWQVSPLNNEGSSIGGWSAPRSFSISAAFIVELELPGNGEVATTSKPTFQWGVIEDAMKYEIQVSNLEDFSEILWSSAEIIENSTQYPGSGAEPLNYGQGYFWRVRAMGEEAPLGDFSAPFSFDLSGENKVELEGPLDEESESLLPYFSWLAVGGASAYTLTLASDESISTIIYSADATEVFHQYPQAAPPLGNGITLYWKVIAKDENGSPVGDASNVGSFSSPSGTIEVEFMFGDE